MKFEGTRCGSCTREWAGFRSGDWSWGSCSTTCEADCLISWVLTGPRKRGWRKVSCFVTIFWSWLKKGLGWWCMLFCLARFNVFI